MAQDKLPKPAGRLRALAGMAFDRVPGASFLQEQFDRLEHRLMAELKERLDRVEASSAKKSEPASLSVLAVQVNTHDHDPGPDGPTDRLRALLDASASQNRDEAVRAAAMTVLRSLLPDEARILSALSDGALYPVIHVYAGPKLSFGSFPMLEYVSTVGRAAGVLAPELTSFYVRRLAAWGMVETAPDEYQRSTDYQLLETDETVRKVLARIQKAGERSRIDRRMLRISDLGRAIWTLCQITEAADVLPPPRDG